MIRDLQPKWDPVRLDGTSRLRIFRVKEQVRNKGGTALKKRPCDHLFICLGGYYEKNAVGY